MSDDIKKRVEERIQAEQAGQDKAEDGGGQKKAEQPDELSDEFILQCFRANRVGDAMIFNALQGGRFVFVKRWGRFLRWAGNHWEEDIQDTALAEVESVCEQYLRVVSKLSKQAESLEGAELKANQELRKGLLGRVSLLRDTSGREKLLTCAHTIREPLSITGDELDQQPYLLAARNCVIDLRTGDSRPGRPEDYILNACPIDWKGIDAPCPEFEKFMLSCHDDNQVMVDFLQRALGYGVLGCRDDHVWLVFYGARGRNGKDTLLKTLMAVLGNDLANVIPTEMLLDSRMPRNSGGPSPDVLSLRGKRLAFASESEDGQRFAMSKIKQLTGGSLLSARGLQDKLYTYWKQTHLLFLLTNEIPRARADDDAFWTRLLAVPWKLRFVDNPSTPDERQRDPQMEYKLQAELPGILAWLVRGALAYQREGLAPPEMVLACTREKRDSFDDVGRFLRECCEVERVPEGEESDLRIGATDLLKAFNWWLHKNVDSSYSYSPRRFGDVLSKKGIPKKKSGGMVYLGVRMQDEVLEEMEADLELENDKKETKNTKRKKLFD
jgi:phage/plasmid primase, P4 family, C-terminal domain